MRLSGGNNSRVQGAYLCTCLILAICGSWMVLGGMPSNAPKQLRADVNWQAVAGSEAAFQFLNPDTSIIHEMYLLHNAAGTPLLYYADILTPVCIDGVCKPVYVEMYWDLLGHYVGFGEYPDRPLTKYDHDPFLAEDYEKLHGLLLDRNSILDRKSLVDLYDLRAAAGEKIEYNGVEIDGISGATKTEIKSSIVSGALYSCYRLWYLAHGDASQKIREYLPEIYSDSLARHFLDSEDGDYRYYAVRQLDGGDFANFTRIRKVFEQGNPLTRKHILKKMPDSLLQRPSIHEPLYQMFPELDGGSKTLLLKKLFLVPAAAPALSNYLDRMTKNQLRTFLQLLKTNPAILTPEVRANLVRFAKDESYVYAYLLEEFLEE